MVEVTRRLNVTPSAVSRWESGEREADSRTIARWAAALGCAVEVRLVPLDGDDISVPVLAAEPAAILAPTTIAAELPALDAEAAEAVLTLIRSLARRPT